jgi:hypothetical protein
MSDPLLSLAARVAADPFFLASALAVYAHSEELDDVGLARRLGCSLEQLPLVRLCRAPRGDHAGRREDVASIAGHYGLDEDALLEAVKRALVIQRLQGVAPAQGGMLMAARDREDAPGRGPEAP